MPPRRRSYSRKRSVSRRRAAPRRRSTYRRAAPRRSRRMARTACVCPGDLSPGAKFALAQLDPFAVQATGAKIPDSTTIPSISSTDIEQVSLLSSAVATDLGGMAFRPQYTWGTQTATAGATLGWGVGYANNSANRSKRTPYGAAIELTRPVAHAIRISSPVAPTSATGFVHIAISTESTFGASTWQYPTTVALISGCQFYKRVTLASLTQSPMTIINKWLDDTAFRYSGPASDLSSGTGNSWQTDFSWGTIVIITEGVPVSSTVISAEHLLMSEGIPQKDGPIIGSAAASSSSGTLSAVSGMTASTEPFHSEAEQEGYVQRGANALLRGAREQGAAIVNNVAVPVLESVGAHAVNTALAYFQQSIVGTGGIGGVNNNAGRIGN